MNVRGGHALQRDKSVRTKLAIIVGLLNILVCACLVFTVYVYRHVHLDVEGPILEEDIHIKFVAIGGASRNGTLLFGAVGSSHMMGLVDGRKDRIYINCTGPYVLYMEVCYKSLWGQVSRGTLQLQVAGTNATVSSFGLTASHEACRGLHSVAYLKAKQEASLHLYASDGFKLKNVTVGLNYLLGRRCEF